MIECLNKINSVCSECLNIPQDKSFELQINNVLPAVKASAITPPTEVGG